MSRGNRFALPSWLDRAGSRCRIDQVPCKLLHLRPNQPRSQRHHLPLSIAALAASPAAPGSICDCLAGCDVPGPLQPRLRGGDRHGTPWACSRCLYARPTSAGSPARAFGGSVSTGPAWPPTQRTDRPWSGRRRAGGTGFGWQRSGHLPTPSTWAAWSSTRPWPRGGSSCRVPRHRRRPTTGEPSLARRGGGPLETRTPGGWRAGDSSPMALHGGGHAPGRQGRPAHPAAGGEGTTSPHTAWLHRQGRGRRQNAPPHGRKPLALGRGFPAPGPSHHGHLGQAGGFWCIARPGSAPGHHPVAVPILGASGVTSRPRHAATGATGPGRGLGRGEPLGGCSPYAAHAGPPGVAPTWRASGGTFSRSSGRWWRTSEATQPPGWTLCPTTCGPLTSPKTGPNPFRARARPPAPRCGLPCGRRPPPGRGLGL